MIKNVFKRTIKTKNHCKQVRLSCSIFIEKIVKSMHYDSHHKHITTTHNTHIFASALPTPTYTHTYHSFTSRSHIHIHHYPPSHHTLCPSHIPPTLPPHTLPHTPTHTSHIPPHPHTHTHPQHMEK